MANTNDSTSLSEKSWGFAEKVFNAVWSSESPHDIWHWMVLLIIAALVIGVLSTTTFKAFGKIIEQLVKLVENYKSSGLPMLLSQDNKTRVRRRKQFCGVLDADLSYLAKAENWNDQYFTDLEAEVETEGGYYATAWHRMRRKKSYGLRKERSLIQAITSSAERAMQLVGEPGAGKSVALRHLAKQFAELGKKSNDKYATVPLYVNLREMETGSSGEITADNVREFVIDNIRRGDADTSAFVRENWEDYCDRGIWLFLFDSFDEIPAVLHSEAGSNVVRQYSQAIRQFLEGMGECKGILASREFKGPEALPWKKLRILPLSGAKQDELIQNSFLNPLQMSLVRQHLAISDSSIGSTPLFLTLLCRYIRDEQKSPNNDHDILIQHVERLARREPDYLQRKYKLSVEELVDGAERLAQLFAEDETLSLAPSLDQITRQLPENQVPGKSIERLISALVDCKIGRADVPNAAHGDRRFAFAHRRYQEALFVRYLTRHPEAIEAIELLTEPRWREYTVTLLQTREPSEIHNLLEVARDMLEKRASEQLAVKNSEQEETRHSFFFEWNNEVAVPLLTLLQEGLSRRLQDVPNSLALAVYNFLKPRWLTGDTWDRCEVIRLGGLLPHDILIEYLVESFAYGTKGEREQAFRQTVFVSALPENSRSSVLEMLSDEVLLADNRADQLSVEALAARLPPSMGASFVVSRGVSIRSKLKIFQKISSILQLVFPFRFIMRSVALMSGEISPVIDSKNKSRRSIPPIPILIMPLFFMVMLLIATLLSLSKSDGYSLWGLFWIIVSFILIYVLMFCPFLVRAYGKKIGFSDIFGWASKNLTFTRAVLVAKATGLVLIFFAAFWPLGYIVDLVARVWFNLHPIAKENPDSFQIIGLGFAAFMVLFYSFGIPFTLVTFYGGRSRMRTWGKRLTDLKNSDLSDFCILCAASDVNELSYWLRTDFSLLRTVTCVRAFSSFVLNSARSALRSDCKISKLTLPDCLSADQLPEVKLRRVRQNLEDRHKIILANGSEG